ncbi:MAG TPA: serine/threonine-protein phosphatase, partial [Pseudolysinimonas sp.]
MLVEGLPTFAVFNIGDSRVYRYEGHELVRVTTDHSVVQELVDAGVLAPEDAERHPESNVITRALGFRDDPRPDVVMVPARQGLRLLICSDGLTKELGDDRILELLAAAKPA